MTEQLYLEDSYLKDIEATVTKVDGTEVILDKTIFYPLSGGQPGDHGTFVCEGKQYSVLNTIKKGPEIIHEVDSEGLKEGDKVTCILDWSRRHKFMRAHTACHIFCYVVHKETGALITGNQISEEKCRIDFNLESFDRDKMMSFEKVTNDILSEGAEVETKFLPREEAFEIPEVLKLKNVLPPSVEMIRIVDVTGHDIQACGGTHVKNLSEIGNIEITKIDNRGKNNRRVYFVLKD